MNKRRFAYLLLVSAVFAYSLPAGAEEIPGIEVEISRIAAAGTEAENAGSEEIETEAETADITGTAAAETEIDNAEQSADGGYDYNPEEILYLTGVRECAFRDGLSYTLCSPDGEESPLLLIRQEDETDSPLMLYRYEEDTKSAVRAEVLTGSGLEAFMKDPENHWDELVWVDSGQWPDGTVVGVAQQTGDPGEENDFYLSANYDWLKETRVHSQGEISSPTADLEETVSRNKRRMLEDRETYQGEDIRRVRAYLDLATDWEKRNAEGVEPVRKYLDSFHEISSLPELTGYLTDPEENPFCRMADLSVTLDLKDTADWIVQIREDSFSILPRDFQRLPEEEIEETRSDFDTQAGHVLRRAGYPDEEVQRILRECRGMEDQLLPCAWPQEGEEEEPDLILPFDEAVKFCSNFPLGQLLEACGVNSGRVSIVYPAYLRKLDELYTEENLSMLRSYLIAHTARDACAYLDLEAMKICNGYEENGELSEEAFTEQLNAGYEGEVLSPRELMGVAEENAYMTYFVDPDVRAELTELTKEIRDTFREILLRQDWLSGEGKRAAQAKLDNMSFCILAPDELIDTSYLEVDPEGSFLDAFARLTVSTLKHNLSFAGRAREKSEWRYDLRREIASSQTNAFYYGTFNQFFVFAGYVTDSTYRTDMPSEEKLAKLGEIIGHELTHGFDPTGIRYDMNGNLPVSDDSISGWLPEEDYEAFMERARKIADYFDRIHPFPNAACPGKIEWGEAAADIGGLAICLEIAKKDPAFDYDRFFRSHAQLWVKQSTLNWEAGDLYDSHPLSHLRINVTVQQFDEFMDTYGVKEGDLMYLAPEDRISIWERGPAGE